MPPKSTGLEAVKAKQEFLRPWRGDLAFLRRERRGLLLAGALAAVFLLLTCIYSIDRGFHVDELATINEGRTRVLDESFQAQHGLFLDVYHHYIESTMDSSGPKLLLWRLPSILPAALGLFFLGVIGIRLFGPAVGTLAPLLLLCLPRFWVSAMEMRFYGIMFFLGVVALGGVLLAMRGRVLSGMLAAGLSGYLCYRMQPAGLPFHGMAVLAGLAATAWWGVQGGRNLLDWHRDGRKGGLPLLSAWPVGVGAVGLLGALVAAVGFFPRMMGLLRSLSDRRGNLPEEHMPEGWEALQVIRHTLSWPGHSGLPLMDDGARYLLGALLLAGAGLLVLRRRWALAAILFLLWLIPHVLTFAVSWHVQFSIKYLSSTLPMLGLLVALGVVAVGELAAAMRLPRPYAGAAGVVLLVPLFWTALASVPASLADDPSNAHRIARRAVQSAPDEAVALLAPTPAVLALEEMAALGFDPGLEIHERQRVGEVVEETLVVRDRRFFRAEYTMANLRRVAGLDVEGPGVRVHREYRSSFNPRFNLTLYEVVADPVLPAGVGGGLVPGVPFALVDPGEWVVEAPEGSAVVIGGGSYTNGDILHVEEPAAFTWSGGTDGGGEVALHPAWEDGPARRSPLHATSGSMYEHNGPMEDRWRLINNLTVGYTFDLPAEPAVIVLETSSEPPGQQTLLLRLDEEEGELHVNPGRETSEGVVEYHYHVPARHLGSRREFFVTMLSENAVNREKDENTRALDILGVRVEMAPGDGAPGVQTRAAIARRAETPDWPPPPHVGAGPPEAAAYISLVGDGAQPAGAHSNGSSVTFSIPPGCTTDGLLVRPIPVVVGEGYILELAYSTANLQVSNIASLAMFLDASGRTISQATVSQKTVGRHTRGVTWRSGLLQAPAGTAFLAPLLFLNLPPGQDMESDATITLEDLRLWRLQGG